MEKYHSKMNTKWLRIPAATNPASGVRLNFHFTLKSTQVSLIKEGHVAPISNGTLLTKIVLI